MPISANLCSPTPQKRVLVIGGCHGTCFLQGSDDEASWTGRRQFLLANCILLTVSMAILALAVVLALAWT